MTANSLLFAAIQMLLALMKYGGTMLLEHPAPAEWFPACPSIYYLCFVMWLNTTKLINFVKFEQGRHGQIAVKPTQVIALRLPTAKKHLNTKYGHQPPLPKRKLYGKRENGEWSTTAAKEYPDSMNKAIAYSFLDTVKEAQLVTP
eukprot:TRINITY_DN19398_c0_g1_i2.p1 TRINITY_DN19398_c0_g1~~TRINITY_DN19398_c0_g1_i2.p1  ORF type:complete len:166 (+),score=7.24 TRINITY_DN19398_c0_g1_i2:65-499(+)